MKFAVVTDIHGNLEALNKILESIKLQNVDEIISLGDAIAIGPYPKEVMALLIKHKVKMIMGNHEQYYLMNDEALSAMVKYEGELNHQRWVQQTLGDTYREVIEGLPWMLQYEFGKMVVNFMHYAIEESWFKPFLDKPDVDSLKTLFGASEHSLYIFGHHHPQHEIFDECLDIRYLNPGSAGCTDESKTQYLLLDIDKNGYSYDIIKVQYDRDKTLNGFDQEKVPEAAIIKKIFFGCEKE